MGLSPELIQELKRELRRLEAERAAIDSTIARLRDLLQPDSARVRDRASPTTAEPPQPRTSATSAGGIGHLRFRDAVRTVLREAQGPLAGPAVAEAMRSRGYRGVESGKLTQRVANELWKLGEREEVVKSDEGYSIKE